MDIYGVNVSSLTEAERVDICTRAAHRYARSYRGFLAILDTWLASYLKDKPKAPQLSL